MTHQNPEKRDGGWSGLSDAPGLADASSVTSSEIAANSSRLSGVSAELDDLDPTLLEMVEIFTQRTLAGESVDVDELVACFPGWDDAFRRLLPALRGLAALDHAGDPTGDPDVDDPAQGRIFGDFQIVREIGRGGMGIVYEARQLALGRRVALKVLPAAAALDPKALERFQLEAQVAGLLQHSRIVPVHAVGTVGELPYFAMQYIEGGSLAWLIAELRGLVDRGGDRAPSPSSGDSPSALALGLLTGRFAPSGSGPDGDWHHPAANSETDKPSVSAPQSICGRAYLRTIARLGIQAAEALDYAHDQRIVHRDVKPANLLLDRHGELWVADFGMADVQGDAGLTLTGDLPGTLRYMSPEQAAGKRALIDRRTDIYSLGATLYELLTLQPAIVGSDRAEIIRRVAEEEPEPIRRLNPAVPVDLATVVTKALSKEPGKRYDTAQQLADDLERFLDGRPIAARPVGPLARTWRWCRRKPVQASLSAALVLALVVGFTGITWNWWKAQAAEKRARREAANARSAEQDALHQSAKADAINRFLIDKLLGQAMASRNPHAGSVTLREALDRAADEVGPSFKGQPNIEADIRMAIAQAYHDLGDYPKCEAHYRAAYDIRRSRPGESDESRLDAMTKLGHALSHLDRAAEAETYIAQAVQETRAALGPGHSISLLAAGYLAILYDRAGRVDEAEALYRSLIQESSRSLGPRAPRTITAMNNLFSILVKRGRLHEAEQVYRECWPLNLEVYGPRHPDALITHANHAAVLVRQGRLEEAEAIFRQTLEARLEVIGPNHPDTLQNLHALAEVLALRGRRDQAEKLLRDAVESRRQGLGADHPEIVRILKLHDTISKNREQPGPAQKP